MVALIGIVRITGIITGIADSETGITHVQELCANIYRKQSSTLRSFSVIWQKSWTWIWRLAFVFLFQPRHTLQRVHLDCLDLQFSTIITRTFKLCIRISMELVQLLVPTKPSVNLAQCWLSKSVNLLANRTFHLFLLLSSSFFQHMNFQKSFI